MELVETIRDVEAVLHCQGWIVDGRGGGGGRTGVVVDGEGFSELRGGIYTPLGTANIQVDIDVNESPEGSKVRSFGCPMCEIIRGVNQVPNPRLWSSETTSETTIMAHRAQPISIETLLQKQKEEKEAASRVSPRRSPTICPWVNLSHPPTAQVPHQGPTCRTHTCQT